MGAIISIFESIGQFFLQLPTIILGLLKLIPDLIMLVPKILSIIPEILKLVPEALKIVTLIIQHLPLIIKLIPKVLNIFVWLLIKLPITIENITRIIRLFIRRTLNIVFAVIISFGLLIFGLNFGMSNIIGFENFPLFFIIFFAIILIIQLINTDNSYLILKRVNRHLTNILTKILDNTIIKDLVGFNVNLNTENPEKNVDLLFKWFSKNLFKVTLILFVSVYLGKKIVTKTMDYLNIEL